MDISLASPRQPEFTQPGTYVSASSFNPGTLTAPERPEPVKAPNGNMYTLPTCRKSLNWMELPSTLLGKNTAAGTNVETWQLVHEVNCDDSSKVSAVTGEFSCLVSTWVGCAWAVSHAADTWTYTFSGTNSAPGGDGLAVAFQYSAQAP